MTLLLQDTLILSPATAKKLQQEIDDLAGATDCADVVGTHADLENYDTSGLTDKAIIKVLQDETQNDAQTYYRYSKANDSFTLVGELGPYYTKAENDILLAAKQDKPVSAVQNNIATFDSTKNTVDSGKAFTTSIADSSNAVDTKIPTELAVRTELEKKVAHYSTMPVASASNVNEIVQYTGETNQNYINGYFYKNVSSGYGVEFTPREGTTTVISISPEDFHAFLEDKCEGRNFTADDVTHGMIGYYNAERYSFSMDTADPNKWASLSFTITELEEAGFTFSPYLGAQQGVDYACGASTYAWENISVQESFPDQTGKAGKFLVTDGTNPEWSNVLPSTVTSEYEFSSNFSRGYGLKQMTIGSDVIGLEINVLQNHGALTSYYLGNGRFWSSGNTELGRSNSKWTKVYALELNNGNAIAIPTVAGKMSVQVSTMPTAAATYDGQLYQYIGTTDQNYTQGYFYLCVSDGATPPTYSWVKVSVMDTSDKVDKVNTASQVYGTDAQGAQTTYNIDSFGQVDDVRVNGTTIVNNKIASITVDSALNNASSNPVQNQTVTNAIAEKSGVVFRNWNA